MMKQTYAVLSATLCILFAQTAVALPDVYVPWPCGVSYKITQGHGGGSHADAINRWAWDIGIPVGGDVVAPADGIVRAVRMDSTRGGCDSSFVNDANYIVIDFADGTDANFTHLQANSTSLVVGSPVKRGDVVGKVGLTGWVCGAHLHFQFQNTCSTPACNSIQANFVGYGDPAAGTTLESNNCPADPCTLTVDSAGELVIDEKNESCFERVTSYFWLVREGHEDHHYFTYTAQVPDPETIGRWHFDVTEPGTYEVRAFVPDTEASSANALYSIETSLGVATSEPLDQAQRKGWQSVGVFEFPAGPASVALTDNTGEDAAKLAFDALSLVWVPAPPPMEPDVTDMGTPAEPAPDMGTGDDGAPGGDGGEPGDDAGGHDGGGENPAVITSEGNACSTSGALRPGTAVPFLIVAGFLVGARRRSRRRRLE